MRITEIKNISQKIFNNASGKIESNQTNPFGVNFKGNMITADVFDSSEKSNIPFTGIAAKVADKSKMLSSAIVGSINDVNQAIKTRLDSVMAIGRSIKEKSSAAWNYLNETKVVWSNESLKNMLTLRLSENPYSARKLEKMPVSDLRDMMQRAIATMEVA